TLASFSRPQVPLKHAEQENSQRREYALLYDKQVLSPLDISLLLAHQRASLSCLFSPFPGWSLQQNERLAYIFSRRALGFRLFHHRRCSAMQDIALVRYKQHRALHNKVDTML